MLSVLSKLLRWHWCVMLCCVERYGVCSMSYEIALKIRARRGLTEKWRSHPVHVG